MPTVRFHAQEGTDRLQDAIRRHDRALLEQLVSERFAFVSGRALGRLGKTDWIAAAVRVEWKSFAVSVLRVIDIGDMVVVVDYDIDQVMQSAPSWAPEAPTQTRWAITDVWTAEGDQWRLVCRHPELRA